MAIQRISGNDIKQNSIDNDDLKDRIITNSKIDNDAITTDKILDGTIVNNDISTSANIDVAKINWSQTNLNWFISTMQWPEGIYFQNFDLQTSTTQIGLSISNSTIMNWYLPFPLTFNYLSYIISRSGNSSNNIVWSIYDSTGSRIYTSGLQSTAAGSYKLVGTGVKLLPGVYYSLIYTNDSGIRFVTSQGLYSAVIPNTGYYQNTSFNTPTQLNFSSISNDVNKQPWMSISKI